MAVGSVKKMSDAAPPDDLVSITEGAKRTKLTWAQIDHAVNKRRIRHWTLGLKKVRYVSLTELRAYEQEVGILRPAFEEGASANEGNEEK